MDYIFILLLVSFTLLSRKLIITKSIITSLLILIFAFWFISNLFTGQGITDAVYYHLANTSRGVSLDDIKWKVVASLIFIVSITALIAVSWWLKKTRKTFNTHLVTALYLVTLFSINSVNFFPDFVRSVKNLSYGNGDLVASDYQSLKTVADKKYNYVFIYAESLERSLQDLDGKNYTPHLKEIADNNLEFTNLQQTPGMGWTMAGMVNTQCAIPLVLPQGNAAENLSHFLSGAQCVGSWFTRNNYTTEFIRGSDKEFAGGDKFFSQHGWKEQHDKEYFISHNLVRPEQISGWGVHDDVLLEHSYQEYERLSASKQPFVLSLLTVNTHAPSGTFLNVCDNHVPNSINNAMLRSVACSDYLIANFIKKISASKSFDNTVIVLVSDHLMMANDASKLLNADKDSRRNRFVIIKKDIKPQKINTPGTLADVWPTIFDVTMSKNPSFGFGVSLLRERQSSLIKTFAKNGNINDYLAYASTLWQFPSLNDKIEYVSGKLSINSQQFNMPLYASVDNNNNIKELYFDGFAKNAPLLSMKSDVIFYANICENISINRNDVCAYKISKNKIEQYYIDKRGMHHIKDIDKESILFTRNLLGISTGFVPDTGISSVSNDFLIKRGMTFMSSENGFSPSKALYIDTCAGETAESSVIKKLAKKSDAPIIFASNDSAFCGDKKALSEIASALNIKDVADLSFRQQITGIYSKNKTQYVVGKPNVPLDVFIDTKTFDVIKVCDIFLDCQ